ncbi:peptidylprolyl isomerase [Pseudemcibacter aquimaris]|uniref:peptidylprolyl isomerase n=1 Tax=Pseudemcibacter aquimaris TaxID=2857064 RepID=UPI002011349D|nr:peptidylprolyl isomerase [Pseudemcibacter aquimaris]MCC3859946.1 SurA N-terminal domain-containing protein [Pseudemcibacter aquimaris]WDU57278.1 SurA N-terminal domain-containing protein [Pseudemcibacter aquimaris]
MFEFFRKGMGSIFAGALLAILIASFALFGIGDPLSTLGGSDVAEVGDEKITMNEFSRTFDMDFRQTQARFGETFTMDLAVQFGFGNQVLSQMVDRKSFDVAAKQLGIRVTDEELRNYILSIPAFQDGTGAFNRSFFQQTARSQGYSESQFEDLMRGDLVRGKFVDSLTSNLVTPAIAAETLTKYTTEERTAEVLTIPASKMTAIGEADDETLTTFYNDNNPLYMAPEYRDISYFEISASDLAATIEVTDEAVREMYESRIMSYTTEEERGFMQMLLDDMDAANAAIAELQGGKSFEDVLSDRTGDTAEDATFEPQSRDDFVGLYGEDAANELYALNSGEYTSPVETGFGVYIFKLGEVKEGAVSSFEDVKDGLLADIKNERAIDQLFDVRNTIDDELAAGAPLADIASVINAEVKTVTNVSIEGIMPDGNASSDLPLIVDFLDVAFSRQVGDELELYEGISNKFYMLDVDNIVDSTLKPFDEVKDQVTADWAQNRRVTLATELSDRIIEELSAEGAEAKELAEYQNVDSGEFDLSSVTVDRPNAENTVAADIHSSIFGQDIGGIQKIAAANGDGFVIVRVKDRMLSADVEEAALEGTKEQIKNTMLNDLMAAYTLHLYEELPVTTYENNLQLILDQLVSQTAQ